MSAAAMGAAAMGAAGGAGGGSSFGGSGKCRGGGGTRVSEAARVIPVWTSESTRSSKRLTS